MEKKILIIGGGLTGLTAAYVLGKNNIRVTVMEKEKELGGLLGSFKIGETYLEKTYHHIFRTDKSIIKLIEELGLAQRLKWHESSIGLYYDGGLYPFVTPLDLLRFKPLGIFDKIRMGLVAVYLQKDKKWEKYVKIPAYKWMKKWCGERAYEVVWKPLLVGKFGDKYKEISMAWLWARIHTRGGSKDADGKERLGYLDGGFGLIVDRLSEEIKKSGGEIKLKTEIDDKTLKQIQNDYDAIISTIPSKNVDYLGAVNVIFTSKQNLSRYYWHNINDMKSPFLAFIQHTNLVDKKQYGEDFVYYMGTYVPHGHKFFTESEEKVYDEFFDYLKKIFPEFDRKKIIEKFLFRFKNAQHIVDMNYQLPARGGQASYELNKIKVYSANFAQIFPEDRGTNYAVREGVKVAEVVLEDLA